MQASHRSLPAPQIRTLARQTANREISVQKAEFRKLGIMADWTSEDGSYRTMGQYAYASSAKSMRIIPL